ncbi:hypothetical protein PMAYCL1PPCAC_22707, partial [Pristionchus mayeri]
CPYSRPDHIVHQVTINRTLTLLIVFLQQYFDPRKIVAKTHIVDFAQILHLVRPPFAQLPQFLQQLRLRNRRDGWCCTCCSIPLVEYAPHSSCCSSNWRALSPPKHEAHSCRD